MPEEEAVERTGDEVRGGFSMSAFHVLGVGRFVECE